MIMGERITVDGRRYLIMFQTGCTLFPTHRAKNNPLKKISTNRLFSRKGSPPFIVGETGGIADWVWNSRFIFTPTCRLGEMIQIEFFKWVETTN